eukprot:TRINITY_DN1014_c0_g3_i2.p1 TRINITY_DN1014_c0_g3~~TRINITY_DN1014_c0_g3_i2.p1  ORF type:complete len:305 (-),score=51.09 TRINITY_DN1014_c0_g3_i2:639-1529(-)
MTQPGSKLQRLAQSSREFRDKLIGLTMFDDLSIGEFEADPEDLTLSRQQGSRTLFLDYWTRDALWALIKEHKIEDILHRHGFTNLLLEIDTSDNFVHIVQLYNERNTPDRVLMQLFVRKPTKFNVRSTRAFQDEFKKGHDVMLDKLSDTSLDLITVEWMRLQDYRKPFERQPLPGQIHPGLGISRQVDEMLAHACTIRRRDGIMNIPEYFHNALLYSPQFQFINPAFEGMFRSILAAVTPALEQYGLAAVSWAVAEGKLIDMHRNRRYQWQPEEQVRALSARMKAYFDSQGVRSWF